ncbi:MAG: hypothetical protein RLZZ241_1477 [Bacteroidota bacterium]|jgi:nucleoside-diphosphate-sugar epimerase
MILVTGATGLLGSHVLLEVLKTGRTVRALIRPQRNSACLQSLYHWYGQDAESLLQKVEWVVGDLLDLPSLETALTGVDTVYHCAGMISFDPADEKQLLRINWEGTRNLVDLCLELGVSECCYVSSISVLNGNTAVQTESSEDTGSYSYGYAASKYLAEMEVWRAGQEGLKISIVNPGIIIGPGPSWLGSGRFFVEVHKGLTYFPPGGTGFVGVYDVAQAMLTLMNKQVYGERFILVAENLSFYEILGSIAKAMGVVSPSKKLRFWHLEVLWRLDFMRVLLGGKSRKLTKSTARSLRQIKQYSSQKIIDATGLKFQKIEDVIRSTAAFFSAQSVSE